jgi:hypothetical protein
VAETTTFRWLRKGVALVSLATLAIGCVENGDGRYKARILSTSSGEVCVRPEDPVHDETGGCYPVSPRDADILQTDVCFEARFPFPNDGSRPIYQVRVLDRKCKR